MSNYCVKILDKLYVFSCPPIRMQSSLAWVMLVLLLVAFAGANGESLCSLLQDVPGGPKKRDPGNTL